MTPQNLPVLRTWDKSGAKIEDLTEIVEGDLSDTIGDFDDPPIIYVAAGICNLTVRTRFDYDGGLVDEVTVLPAEQIQETVETTKGSFNNLQHCISRQGGVPAIATIYPMSIGDWNQTRLNQGRTSILRHADSYDEMQASLLLMVDMTNEAILTLNNTYGIKTPQLHKCLFHNRGGNRKNSIKYNLLTDGCHPSLKMIRDLTKSLRKTIALNSLVARAQD